MDKKLYDAAQLLQMLELVFDHSKEAGPSESGFPWAGVKLTLRQARELILESAAERPRNGESPRPQESQQPKRELKKPHNRPSYTGSYGAEPQFRGTFNRIQLTDETLERREETEQLTS